MSDSAANPAPTATDDDLGDLLLEVLPPDGSTIGNGSAREALSRAAVRPQEQGDQRRARIRHYLERWYRARALERLQEKTDRYARQMGVTPAGVGVRTFRARWGSCDQRGQLVFNWPIIKAPHPVVDYVVIHELAHLVHPNHSRAFWQLVERHCPDFGLHRTWLKDQALRLL